MTGQVDRTVIGGGETARLTFTLSNQRPTDVSLMFYSTCQVAAYIVDCRTGTTVYPKGGWACGALVTFLSLAPEGVFEHVVPIQTVTYPSIVLPAGVYAAHATLWTARMGDTTVRDLRSDPVAFTVIE